MATYDTEAVVLRAIRYSEADSVLSLYTRGRGRASAIAKGARKTTSRLGGRLQPGVRLQLSVHEGRGDLGTVRGASVLDANAGLWTAGSRLQAAACVLESVMRTTPEGEASEEVWNLLVRSLGMIARAPAPEPSALPARLDPLVLGFRAKLIVIGGLLPVLGACARCGAGPPLDDFSAAAGGAVCPACAAGADPVGAASIAALAALVGRPLAEAPGAVPAEAAPGVERMLGLVLREHLGVRLRSAAPL